jgi:hypothetical protein
MTRLTLVALPGSATMCSILRTALHYCGHDGHASHPHRDFEHGDGHQIVSREHGVGIITETGWQTGRSRSLRWLA